MVQKEAIIRVIADFDASKSPISDIFDDVATAIAEFIERDFIVEGTEIKSAKAFVEA